MKKQDGRALALILVRDVLRQNGINPALVDADGAECVLQERYKNIELPDPVAKWWGSISENQRHLFRKEWKQFRKELLEASGEIPGKGYQIYPGVRLGVQIGKDIQLALGI